MRVKVADVAMQCNAMLCYAMHMSCCGGWQCDAHVLHHSAPSSMSQPIENNSSVDTNSNDNSNAIL